MSAGSEITAWNTALILVYATAQADLTSIGGPASQTIIDGVNTYRAYRFQWPGDNQSKPH